MCEYCETIDDTNDFRRRFGKVFPKDLNYLRDVCLSWDIKGGIFTDYNLYINDEDIGWDLSVPIKYCPICGRKLDSNI